MSAATLKSIRLECYLPRLSGANRVSLFRVDSLARCLLQCAWDSSVVAMDRKYLIELVRDMRPLWDLRDKNYYNRDLKPKLWDEIGEKLNVAGKYWNNNTYEISYYLLYLFLVIPRRLNFICRRFGTLCPFHLHRQVGMKMEQSVPKRRHIKFRRQGITKKKTYNIQNTAKVWNQGYYLLIYIHYL